MVTTHKGELVQFTAQVAQSRTPYSNLQTLATAGTAQRVGAGTTTFGGEVTDLLISYVTHAVYIAKTLALAGAAAAGGADSRIYIPAGTQNFSIPWSGRDVFFVNAVTGELPQIFVTGFAA